MNDVNTRSFIEPVEDELLCRNSRFCKKVSYHTAGETRSLTAEPHAAGAEWRSIKLSQREDQVPVITSTAQSQTVFNLLAHNWNNVCRFLFCYIVDLRIVTNRTRISEI
jgi:hypothetical protein